MGTIRWVNTIRLGNRRIDGAVNEDAITYTRTPIGARSGDPAWYNCDAANAEADHGTCAESFAALSNNVRVQGVVIIG